MVDVVLYADDVMVLDAIVRECNIDQMLSERCDGNRNILHACVAACAPSSNKDLDAGLFECLLVLSQKSSHHFAIFTAGR